MKKSIVTILAITIIAVACNSSRSLTSVQPKSGNIEIPANGEFRFGRKLYIQVLMLF